MKILNLVFLLAIITSCNIKQSTNQATPVNDNRPKSQLLFNKIVDSLQYDNSTYGNAAKTDLKIEKFNKYALDSLKEIKDWEVIVNDVSEDTGSASSFASNLLDLSKPIYNLKMYSVIKMHDKIDPKLDSLNLPQADVVYITYTTFKEPKALKNIVDLIKTVTPGDTLLISGAITHINSNLKPDFKELILNTSTWNVDLLPSDIRKKK